MPWASSSLGERHHVCFCFYLITMNGVMQNRAFPLIVTHIAIAVSVKNNRNAMSSLYHVALVHLKSCDWLDPARNGEPTLQFPFKNVTPNSAGHFFMWHFASLLSPQLKTCMTTRAGPTSTSHKTLASTCVLLRLRTSVTCLRNKFMFGVDTPRSVGRDMDLLFWLWIVCWWDNVSFRHFCSVVYSFYWPCCW